MKFSYFFVALLLLVGGSNCFAQSPPHSPQATLARLIGTRIDQYKGGSFLPSDSTRNSWSGTRGGGGFPAENSPYLACDLSVTLRNNGSGWKENARTTNTFDADNHLLTVLNEQFDGSNWVNSSREVHIWHANHSLEDTTANFTWSAGNWVGSQRTTHLFDDRGNDTLYIYQNWSTTLGDFVDYQGWDYQYDPAGHLITYMPTIWSGTAISSRTIDYYAYDANGNRISDLQKSWNAGSWSNALVDTFTYNAHNQQLTDLELGWNTTTNAWENSSLTTETYDQSFRNTSYLMQRWNGKSWGNYRLTTYTFWPNNAGYLVVGYTGDSAATGWDSTSSGRHHFNSLGMDVLDSTWSYDASFMDEENGIDTTGYDLAGRATYKRQQNYGTFASPLYWSNYRISYNDFGQFLTYNDSAWDTTLARWVPRENEYYWYENYTGPSSVKTTSTVAATTIASNAYPNPFTTSFAIEFDAKERSGATILLYDITGRLVTRTESSAAIGTNKITIDAGHPLSIGIYTYKLLVGNLVSEGKIVAR